MKTKYDIGDHVLIEAVVTGIQIEEYTTIYKLRTTEAVSPYTTGGASRILKANEEDVFPKPDEFNGCDNCKHDRVPMTAYPCTDCEHNHISHYEPKEDEDVIDE